VVFPPLLKQRHYTRPLFLRTSKKNDDRLLEPIGKARAHPAGLKRIENPVAVFAQLVFGWGSLLQDLHGTNIPVN